MKYHLNIILLALRVVIIIVGLMALVNAFGVYSNIIAPNEYNIASYYFRIKPNALRPVWSAPLFLGLHCVLLVYVDYMLVKLYKSFNNLQKGNVFYERQAADFKAAGAGIIIFAKCKYLLFCVFGAIFFADISIFFAEALPFIVIYLIGKFVLVMFYLSEKGEFLREENDLTI